MTVLLTLTDNPDLLNLHTRQQIVKHKADSKRHVTGWINCLVRALQEKLGESTQDLLQDKERLKLNSENKMIGAIALKLDAMVDLLSLNPFNEKGDCQRIQHSIDYSAIQSALVLCPQTMECETAQCRGKSLHQASQSRDVPHVTLMKGGQIIEGIHVLSGKCTLCDTIYYADHESCPNEKDEFMSRNKIYVNSAKYLKIDQNTWADQQFSNAVVNGIYHFHASTSAIAAF